MMIAERERERWFFSLCFWLQSVQIFISYFSEKDILNWSDWSSLNCRDAKEIIYLYGRLKFYTATVWIQGYKRQNLILFPLFFNVEPTRITVPPLSLDVTTGQSLVLPCEVSSDSSLNPKFKWFFNGKAIDFSRQEHFEMIGKVCMASLEIHSVASARASVHTREEPEHWAELHDGLTNMFPLFVWFLSETPGT